MTGVGVLGQATLSGGEHATAADASTATAELEGDAAGAGLPSLPTPRPAGVARRGPALLQLLLLPASAVRHIRLAPH